MVKMFTLHSARNCLGVFKMPLKRNWFPSYFYFRENGEHAFDKNYIDLDLRLKAFDARTKDNF